MSSGSNFVDDRIYDYILSVSLREDDILRELREETSSMAMAVMQIAPDQGQFMALLAQLVNAQNAIEIGVFTGYSSLCVARALPPDGKLLCCDVSEEWTAVAQRYWQRAGVEEKIELVLQPATQTLQQRIADGERGVYDFAFVDADKENYDNYFELCLELLRPGGLIVFDNVLWSGDVLDTSTDDPETVAFQKLNAKLHHDPRVDISLLPVADGLYLARKR
ncbi:MAG: class I SAM-dependent methyltransferase [Gammaproteobacteria bacterium]|nr:class I SAM-dependent methyltransferase [Gammaproteobacteria bacterium]NND59541.1 SAM-dependent methyltransferase [Gammaproteobacteria bacterium]